MRDINHFDFRRIDLNLVPVFLVLMRERNLTRAAAKLALGQPAVSAALGRLRAAFDDPLFVRQARGMQPTARALALDAQLRPLTESIWKAIYAPPAFDPAKAEMTFRLGMPDNHEHFLLPRLVERILAIAPMVRIAVRPASGMSAGRLLEDGDIDLFCGRLDRVPATLKREMLMKVGFLSLYDPGRIAVKRRLTMAQFLAAPHVLMSHRGDFTGAVDRALARAGHKRRVILATETFGSLPSVIARTGAIGTLPEHSARRFALDYGLATSPPPLPVDGYETALVWLARHDANPALAWLRRVVLEVVREIPAGESREPRPHPRK